MKCEEDLLAVPLPADPKDTSDGRQLHVTAHLAIGIQQPELGASVLLVASEQLSVHYAHTLQHRIILRNDLLPISSRGRGRIHHECPVSRRIFIGSDKYLAVENLSAI